MTHAEIFDAIVAAIREETDNPAAKVSLATTASDVPGWDSLGHVRIMFNASVRAGVDINIDDTYRAANVGELVEVFDKA